MVRYGNTGCLYTCKYLRYPRTPMTSGLQKCAPVGTILCEARTASGASAGRAYRLPNQWPSRALLSTTCIAQQVLQGTKTLSLQKTIIVIHPVCCSVWGLLISIVPIIACASKTGGIPTSTMHAVRSCFFGEGFVIFLIFWGLFGSVLAVFCRRCRCGHGSSGLSQ